MMNTVRDTFSSIGDRSGDIARSVGSGTAGLARRVGSGTVDLAKRVTGRSSSIADQIDGRRALIGIAVAAAAIGGSILLVRYLRARRARDAGLDREDELEVGRAMPPSGRAGVDARVTY